MGEDPINVNAASADVTTGTFLRFQRDTAATLRDHTPRSSPLP